LNTGAATFSSTVTATTGIFSNLTTNYIPKQTAGGLANSLISDDGSTITITKGANTFNLAPNNGGWSEIEDGAILETTQTLNIWGGAATGLKTKIVYLNGTNFSSAFEIANVASGQGTLQLMKSGGNTLIGAANASYNTKILNTTTSTSSTTGALVVGGGIGVGGQLTVYNSSSNLAASFKTSNASWSITNFDAVTNANAGIGFFENGVQKWVIYNRPADGNFRINLDGGTDKFVLSTAGNATFSGSVTAASLNAVSATLTEAFNPSLSFMSTNSGTTNRNWMMYVDYYALGEIDLMVSPSVNVGASVSVLNFKSNGNAKFSGSVTSSSLGSGTVYSNGGTLTNTIPSDQNLKNTINPLNYGLAEILKLQPKSFYYNDDINHQRLQYGFIAQEVQQIMPDVVRPIGNGSTMLGLETNGIYVAGIKAIQELDLKVNDLSSLDTTSATSLGSLITSFLGNETTRIEKIFTKEIDTQNLCVSDSSGARTCITKAELDALLVKEVSSASGGASGSVSDSQTLTCTAPQTLINGVCTDPTADLTIPTCTLPQTLVNNVCTDPVAPLTCTLPQVLESGACVIPTPTVPPAPPICTDPQVLVGGSCVDPTP
jgi:hypothetical protein